MGVVAVAVMWHDSGQHVLRYRGSVFAEGNVASILAELYADEARLTRAVELLRSGAPGPSEHYPEWIDGAQEGVELEQHNGVCMVTHISYEDRGEVVLTSEAMATLLEQTRAMVTSPGWGRKGMSFPDLEVDVLASGPGAWQTYLERGGIIQAGVTFDSGKRRRRTVQQRDGRWVWIWDDTGEIDEPFNGTEGPAPASAEGTESDLEQVVRLLGDVAVTDWDVRPRAADPYATLVEAVAPFERLGPIDRIELPTYLSDYERRSLVDAVKSLCGRALTEQRPDYLSAAALCFELGAAEHDWRDVMIDLAVFHHTATRLEVEPGASGSLGDHRHYPQFAERYREFLARTEKGGRGLETFRLIETNQDGKVRFTRFEPPARNKLGRRRDS